jgi:predicted amidohydrolase YtcJ
MPLDVARLKALGVAVSLPLPATWAPGDVLFTAVPSGRDETSGTAPGSSPVEPHGVRLLMASEPLADPRLGLLALVAGQRPEEVASQSDPEPDSAPAPEPLLIAAIDAYTSTAAWASGDEGRRGTIARDMLADIVILSADLFTLPGDKLLDAVVTATIFDGEVVYDREADTPQTNP